MIEINKYLTRQNVIRVAIALLVTVIVFVSYDNLVFRLKNTSPSLNNVPDSATEIRFQFSQPIDSIDKVFLNDTEIKPLIKGKTVTIPLSRSLETGISYDITLIDIQSDWFGSRIATIEESFTPKYIDFNELSGDDKKAQINASNSGQVDDEFIANSVFPIFNERWQIDATINTERREAYLKVKFFEEVPDYDNNGVVKRVSNDTAENYRNEVLTEIKNRKGNPSDYEIFFENPYLANKYRSTDEH